MYKTEIYFFWSASSGSVEKRRQRAPVCDSLSRRPGDFGLIGRNSGGRIFIWTGFLNNSLVFFPIMLKTTFLNRSFFFFSTNGVAGCVWSKATSRALSTSFGHSGISNIIDITSGCTGRKASYACNPTFTKKLLLASCCPCCCSPIMMQISKSLASSELKVWLETKCLIRGLHRGSVLLHIVVSFHDNERKQQLTIELHRS